MFDPWIANYRQREHNSMVVSKGRFHQNRETSRFTNQSNYFHYFRIVNNGNNRDSPLLGNDSLNEDTVLDLECSLPSPIRECNTSPPRTPMADVTASTSNVPDNENSVEKRKSRKRGRDEKNWIKNVSVIQQLVVLTCST